MYGAKLVTKESILETLHPYDIFKKYVSNFVEVGKKFVSDIRHDKNPTCIIIRLGDTLMYRDFAEFRFLDCFEYIKVKYGVTYLEALQMINLDFNLGLSPSCFMNYTPSPSARYNIPTQAFTKASSVIMVTTRKWNLLDRAFWFDKYQITSKELEFFNVMPIKGFALNNTYIGCDPKAYAYQFGALPDGREAFKIYQPYSKSLKWLSNCTEDILQGYEQLPESGDLLVITKSLKDVVVLRKLGIYAVAPHGETMKLKPEKVEEFKQRFKSVVLLYDNDAPGIIATEKLVSDTGFPSFFLPEGTKDVSDFVEMYSYEVLKIYLDEQISITSGNTTVGR